jgi:hypothetical protein
MVLLKTIQAWFDKNSFSFSCCCHRVKMNEITVETLETRAAATLRQIARNEAIKAYVLESEALYSTSQSSFARTRTPIYPNSSFRQQLD